MAHCRPGSSSVTGRQRGIYLAQLDAHPRFDARGDTDGSKRVRADKPRIPEASGTVRVARSRRPGSRHCGATPSARVRRHGAPRAVADLARCSVPDRHFRGGQALNRPRVMGSLVDCHEVVIRGLVSCSGSGGIVADADVAFSAVRD
jgi:hypothetical protein